MSSFPFAVEFKGNFLHTGTRRLGARKRCMSLEVRYKLFKSWNWDLDTTWPCARWVITGRIEHFYSWCSAMWAEKKLSRRPQRVGLPRHLFPFFQGIEETFLELERTHCSQRLGGQLLTACLQLHGLILWHPYLVTSCGFNKDTGRDLPSLHNGVQVGLQRVKKPHAMETPGRTKAGEKDKVKALIGKTRSAGL